VKPRVHVLTPAVDDLERSLAFYRQLGLESSGIVATEFPGDEENAAGDIAIFELDWGFLLAVYPRSELAKDAKITQPPPTSGSFSIGHAVASREDVDAVLDAAEAADATVTVKAYDRPFGVYSGYFQDPDGHLWEVLWNPALEDIQPAQPLQCQKAVGLAARFVARIERQTICSPSWSRNLPDRHVGGRGESSSLHQPSYRTAA
jgi:uncharacterized protein